MATPKTVLPDYPAGIQNFLGKRELKSVDVRTGLAVFRVRSASGEGPDAPDFPVPISTILPEREDDTLTFWQMLIDSLMKLLKEQNQFPDFVAGYTVATGEDSSGDPALYVTILVSPQKSYTPQAVRSWNKFSNFLLDTLMELRIQRYPYVQIQEKRGKK